MVCGQMLWNYGYKKLPGWERVPDEDTVHSKASFSEIRETNWDKELHLVPLIWALSNSWEFGCMAQWLAVMYCSLGDSLLKKGMVDLGWILLVPVHPSMPKLLHEQLGFKPYRELWNMSEIPWSPLYMSWQIDWIWGISTKRRWLAQVIC